MTIKTEAAKIREIKKTLDNERIDTLTKKLGTLLDVTTREKIKSSEISSLKIETRTDFSKIRNDFNYRLKRNHKTYGYIKFIKDGFIFKPMMNIFIGLENKEIKIFGTKRNLFCYITQLEISYHVL